MASFNKKSPFSYPQAEVLEVLTPCESLCRRRSSTGDIFSKNVTSNSSNKSGQETWKTAFSPDESFFAWSCGNQFVVLLPLNTLGLNYNANDCDRNYEFISQRRVLDCGSHVYSVAFGSSTANRHYNAKNGCWNLHKFNKNLILATGLQNGRISIWEVYTGRILLKLMDHSGLVRDVSFAPDGSLHLASASHDSTVKIWHLKDDGNMCKTFKCQNFMFACSWSPDANKLVSVGKSRIGYVFDMRTYQLAFKLHGHLNSISSCSFSPGGSLIATASYDTCVFIWDSNDGQIIKKLCHQYPQPSLIFASGDNGTWVRSVSFSSDQCHVATVADDGYLRFWDLYDDDEDSAEDPAEIACIQNALCCSYAPSGRFVAVGQRI